MGEYLILPKEVCRDKLKDWTSWPWVFSQWRPA